MTAAPTVQLAHRSGRTEKIAVFQGAARPVCSDGGDGSPVADDCRIADDFFEPFIGVPTKFGEGPLWLDAVEKLEKWDVAKTGGMHVAMEIGLRSGRERVAEVAR